MLCSNLTTVILLVMTAITGTVVANKGAVETYNCGAPFCKRFARFSTSKESETTTTVTTTALRS
jgi:hypothetical protein